MLFVNSCTSVFLVFEVKFKKHVEVQETIRKTIQERNYVLNMYKFILHNVLKSVLSLLE